MGSITSPRTQVRAGITKPRMTPTLALCLIFFTQLIVAQDFCDSPECQVCVKSCDDCNNCSLCALCLGSTIGPCSNCKWCKGGAEGCKKSCEKGKNSEQCNKCRARC